MNAVVNLSLNVLELPAYKWKIIEDNYIQYYNVIWAQTAKYPTCNCNVTMAGIVDKTFTFKLTWQLCSSPVIIEGKIHYFDMQLVV